MTDFDTRLASDWAEDYLPSRSLVTSLADSDEIFTSAGNITPGRLVAADGGADSTGASNAAAALQAQLDSDGYVVLRRNGIYKMAAALDMSAGGILIANGATMVQAASTEVITATATWGTPVNVSSVTQTTHQFPDASAATSAVEVDIGAAHSFAVGDRVRLLASDVPSGGTAGTNAYRTAQFFVVGDVSGNTIYLPGVLRDPMTTDLRIVEVPRVPVIIDGLTVTADSKRASDAILLSGVEPHVYNLSLYALGSRGLRLRGCYDLDVRGVNAWDGRNSDGSTYQGYAVVAEACEGGNVSGLNARQFRHGFTTLSLNLTATTTSVQMMGRTADITVSDSHGFDCYDAPFDTHEAAKGITFVGCNAAQSRSGLGAFAGVGFQLRGIDDQAVGCTASGLYHGFKVLTDSAGNGRSVGFDGCKAHGGVTIGLLVDDNVGGEATVHWRGGQIVAREACVRSNGSERVKVEGAHLVVEATGGFCAFATEESRIDISGGVMENAVGSGQVLVAATPAASHVRVDRATLVGEWSELLDSSRQGTAQFIELDRSAATVTALGGASAAKARATFAPLYAIKTWDPADIATGAATSTTQTVTGAAVGDLVMVGHEVAVPAGCVLSGSVTATDTVTITLANLSGSNVNLDSAVTNIVVVPFL